MSGRHVVIAICAVLGLTGCSEQRLGRQEPACDPTILSNAIVLAAQSLPGTAYAPCINDLKVGWSSEHLVAESGRSRLWLSSDRLGIRFVEVTMTASCDTSNATEVTSDEPGTRRYDDVIVSDFSTSVAIVPEGDEQGARDYATTISAQISRTVLAGRRLDVTLDDGPRTTQERIDAALAAQLPVIVTSVRGEEQGTVELQLPTRSGRLAQMDPAIPLARALERIERQLDEPRYQASWYYRFDGGCVAYDIDAHGPGVASVSADIEKALGLYPLAPARQWARQQGYVVP
jgi:hypothetical protein